MGDRRKVLFIQETHTHTNNKTHKNKQGKMNKQRHRVETKSNHICIFPGYLHDKYTKGATTPNDHLPNFIRLLL